MHAFTAAARRFVELESARQPDFSGIVVLVPHHHAATPFLSALRQELVAPVFLPPQLLTLPALAARAEGDTDVPTHSQRLSRLYALLRSFDWIAAEARWPMAFELLDLIEEMDASLLSPPEVFADFDAHLRALSRRLRSAPLTREASLIYQVWRAFHQGQSSPMRDYALRLGRWAGSGSTPLYTLGLHGLSRLESRFIEQCAQTRPVHALPLALPHSERLDLLQRLWPVDSPRPAASDADLRTRALACRASLPESPLLGRLNLIDADTLEAEANEVAARIRDWVAEGKRRIGVIALDRLAARRLRAVLERDALLMQDETGWTFSTTAVSHVLDRLLALLSDDFYFRDLLDLLKSPYLFADDDRPLGDVQLPEFERALNKHSVTRGLSGFQRLARQAGLALIESRLNCLGEATSALARPGTRTLTEWLKALLSALTVLGVTPAWQRDSAGMQLLSLLQRLSHELAHDPARHDFEEWRAWLDRQLDRATFLEGDIDSPIRLSHLNAARLRDFEAVVVLGTDAAHLPPPARNGTLSDTLRQELGLPGQSQAQTQARQALIEVLCQTDTAIFTWQRSIDGNPNTPSPWIETLELFHRLAYTESLYAGPWLAAACAAGEAGAKPAAPPPSLDYLPERLSASGWQALVNCPYRFFARYGLRLGESDEAVEAMEKRQYGELLHAILARFHADRADLAVAGRAELGAELARLSDQVFAEAGVGDYLVRAWRLRWEKHLDAYIDWALERATAGFRWSASEAVFERPLPLGEGRSLNLYGRIDRIDTGPDGLAVVDYKTQGLTPLRTKLKWPGEDVQLPFYGLLSGAAHAEFVSLDDKRVDGVRLDDLTEAMATEELRLTTTFDALAAGAGLPATGAPGTCQWCEMHGLCRLEHHASE